MSRNEVALFTPIGRTTDDRRWFRALNNEYEHRLEPSRANAWHTRDERGISSVAKTMFAVFATRQRPYVKVHLRSA